MWQDLRTFFNAKAPSWDAIQDVPREKLAKLLIQLPIASGGTILDVGSGTGVLVPFLRELFAPRLIVELDIAEAMLAEARKKFGDWGIRYILGDAKDVIFDETFDAILCYSSFPHFADKEGTVRHLVRFLNDRGVFAILHTSGRAQIHAIHAQDAITRDHFLPEGHEVAQMLANAGLRVLVVRDAEEEYLVAGVREGARGEDK